MVIAFCRIFMRFSDMRMSMIRLVTVALSGLTAAGAAASEPPRLAYPPQSPSNLSGSIFGGVSSSKAQETITGRPSGRAAQPSAAGNPAMDGIGSGTGAAIQPGNLPSSLPAINLRYSVIRQPLPKTLQELFSLAGVNFVLESELTDTITNGTFAGSLAEILDDLGRRYNFVWTYGNGVVEIVHVKQVVSRTLKLGGGIDQTRIAAILRASDINPETPLVRYEPEASLLRVRGSARFVARVEAALNLAVSKEDSVNVIRYGRTFKVIDQ